ncbi:hypothetical protein DAEQUDRAFT_747693 [Daedalea quercina L-15889]|uniref:Clavaminate synthase-like protein n=1 Tax=Daedalea quercina L-15889 TaxID=1314783 RepID=A0A165L3A6_9APHY|nr:hypothetical protein DAEQUDRAFT_747693 [Daedalea quercina L-15889]
MRSATFCGWDASVRAYQRVTVVRGPPPPFPEDVPTRPLLVVDHELVKAGDRAEVEKLWDHAAAHLGFWFETGAETTALALEEKVRFEQGDGGMSCGYESHERGRGALDTAEFINVAKDDARAGGWPGQVHRAYPPTVNARMASTVAPFVRKSLAVNGTLLGSARRARRGGDRAARGAQRRERGAVHRLDATPARPDEADSALLQSFVHDRLGGLHWQAMVVPGTTPPWPGGFLTANIHRAVAPPKEQAQHVRWSLVFFTRPGNSVALHPLAEESALVAKAVAEPGWQV